MSNFFALLTIGGYHSGPIFSIIHQGIETHKAQKCIFYENVIMLKEFSGAHAPLIGWRTLKTRAPASIRIPEAPTPHQQLLKLRESSHPLREPHSYLSIVIWVRSLTKDIYIRGTLRKPRFGLPSLWIITCAGHNPRPQVPRRLLWI